MNTETLLREHFGTAANDVEIGAQSLEKITDRVHRTRWVWGVAAAAVLVLSVAAVGMVRGSQEQILTPQPVVSDGGPSLEWSYVSVDPDAGPVIQVIPARDGGFLLLTDSQRWFHSADGSSWTEFEPTGFGDGGRITMLVDTEFRLVAAGTAFDNTPLLATSIDGYGWEAAMPGDSPKGIPVSIASVANTILVPFVNGAYESVAYRFTVDQGWQSAELPEPAIQVLAMSALDNFFYAEVTDPKGGFPHRDYRSSDGEDWERALTVPPIQINKPLTQPIVSGPGGWYLTTYGDDEGHRLLKSTDGETWSTAVDATFEFGPPSLAGTENGIVAAMPASGDPGSGQSLTVVLYSVDGESWSVQDLGLEFDTTEGGVDVALNAERVIVGSGSLELGETVVWVADR